MYLGCRAWGLGFGVVGCLAIRIWGVGSRVWAWDFSFRGCTAQGLRTKQAWNPIPRSLMNRLLIVLQCVLAGEDLKSQP